ncbi:MAG: hypothetical protein ABJE95_22370 [Byssovorax sp.]
MAIGVNTLASFTAIALWVVGPRRGEAPAASPFVVASRPAAQDQPMPPLPRGIPIRIVPGAAPPQSIEGPIHAVPDTLSRPTAKQGGGGAVPASVVALGERLHLNPQVLSSQLGDERGEISTLAADRLEQGFKKAEALAKRLGLDESRTQSLVALITYHAFSLLREEKKAAPGGVDGARIDELTEALLDDIRITCGDAAAAEAKGTLGGL